MSDRAPTSGGSSGGLSKREAVLLALFVGLTALTAMTALTAWRTELPFAVLAPDVDLLINGVATLVAGAAAWLSWLRHRHIADQAAAYQAAAFLLFAVSNAAQTLAGLDIGKELLGLDLGSPRQAPLYVWSMVRVLAGTLLLRGAWLRLRPAPGSYRHAGLIVVLSLLAAAAAAGALYAVEPMLPPLLGAEAIERMSTPGTVSGTLPGITLLEVALQAVVVAVLAGAAVGYALAARRGTGAADAYLAAGLLLAAFAQVHFALFPGIYSGLVTSSDLLRLCFYGFVVFGIQAAAGATLGQLRAANRRLHELHELELANASLAERTRLARELHDGLAQHLWLSKLAAERLSDGAPREEIERVRAELLTLLDAGLVEARQTVMALRGATHANAPLAELLGRHVRRFEEQTGLTARLDLVGLGDGPLPPRATAELLRIAQEALTNVRKHADATVVTIEATRDDDAIRLSVRDNGIGFDPAADHPGFGLESMAERAAALGGRLVVEASPLGGTLVRAEIPLSGGAVRRDDT